MMFFFLSSFNFASRSTAELRRNARMTVACVSVPST